MSVAPPGVASRGIRKSTRQSPKNMENQMIVPTVTTWGHGCEYIWSSFQQMGRWSRLQKSVFRKLRPRAVKVLFLAHKRCVTFRTFASLQKKDYVTIMYVIQTWIHTRRPQVPKVTYWFTSFTMIHNGWFYTICGPWHQDRLKNQGHNLPHALVVPINLDNLSQKIYTPLGKIPELVEGKIYKAPVFHSETTVSSSFL